MGNTKKGFLETGKLLGTEGQSSGSVTGEDKGLSQRCLSGWFLLRLLLEWSLVFKLLK